MAQALLDARLRSQMCSLPDDFEGRPRTEAEGYAVQDVHVELLQRHFGGGISGYKAGFITRDMREQFGGIKTLGMDSPTYGRLLERFTFRKRATVPFNKLLRPSVECELAVQMAEDVPRIKSPYTRSSIAPYVESFMAGIELVDFHIPFLSHTPPLGPLMLADNCCNWGVVVGAPMREWPQLNLETLRGELRQDGRLIEAGTGAALAGHPLEVLVALQNHLLDIGQTLRAGEIVMLGSVVRNYVVPAPCEISVQWDVLGEATALFE